MLCTDGILRSEVFGSKNAAKATIRQYPLETGCKLNVNNTLRRCLGRSVYVLRPGMKVFDITSSIF